MSKSYWIWHYGDFEIYHITAVNQRREERKYIRPAFWYQHTPYVSIKFRKSFESEGGTLKAYFNGQGHIAVNGVRYSENMVAKIPSGKCVVEASVANVGGLPAVFVESVVCPSDGTWESQPFVGAFSPVGCMESLDSPENNPEKFPFQYEKIFPESAEKINGGTLYDFGKELFGHLNIEGADKNEEISVFYGESREEALETNRSYLIDNLKGSESYRLKQRAVRCVFINDASDEIKVSLDYEFLPLEKRGTFSCDNELFNKIYSAAVHTFHLNCREGFLDGIKRDRWVWAGDAYQSAKINSYLFADKEIEQRTMLGLVGKKPVLQHLNLILDYSLLWLIGLYEHYMIYGDYKFLNRIYDMAKELLSFCETRINSKGFLEGKDGDWIFIDWSDMDKEGAVCAEQMLLVAAYTAMGDMAKILDQEYSVYWEKAEALKKLINEYYWNENLGAFIDSYSSGKNNVTRHANIFALMYDIASAEQKESIIKNVLENSSIPQITTPYFRGYELDVLARLGKFSEVEEVLNTYWGEMINQGATTIWEAFDPQKTGVEHYSMYGSKYDKSLCHAWGAGPVYIFGKYYLGVTPTSAGFETFNVEPHLGGLKEINGVVPIGSGRVEITLTEKCLTVKSTKSGGTLLWDGKQYPLKENEEVTIQKT